MRVDPITEMAPKWLVGVVLRAKGCSPGATDPGDPDDPAWDLSLVGWGAPRALHSPWHPTPGGAIGAPRAFAAWRSLCHLSAEMAQ